MSIETIAEQIAAEHDLAKAKAREIVQQVLREIAATTTSGECRLAGFGTFHISERKASTARHPRTGEAIAIPPQRIVRFRAAKRLRDRVNPPAPAALADYRTPAQETPPGGGVLRIARSQI